MGSFNEPLSCLTSNRLNNLKSELERCGLEQITNEEYVQHLVAELSLAAVTLSDGLPPEVTEGKDGLKVLVKTPASAGPVELLDKYDVEKPSYNEVLYIRDKAVHSVRTFPHDAATDDVRAWVKAERERHHRIVKGFNDAALALNGQLQEMAQKIAAKRRAAGGRASQLAADIQDL